MPTASPVLADAEARRIRLGRTHRSRFVNPSLISGLSILIFVVAFVVLYPLAVSYSPTEPDFNAGAFLGPSLDHPLGTDNFGRDVLTRLAYGGRIDLLISVIATAVTFAIGTALGLLSGYFGGAFDTFIMRLVDFVLTLPYLILVIAVIAVLGTGTSKVVIAIWLVGWVTYTRIVRAETLLVSRLEFVEAARVIGSSSGRIMRRHVLPNVLGASIVYSMVDVVLNILLISSLSFLGLAVQPPDPEWGVMIAEARNFFLRDWRLMTYPGLAILVLGAGFGLVGDGLAQALRPRD